MRLGMTSSRCLRMRLFQIALKPLNVCRNFGFRPKQNSHLCAPFPDKNGNEAQSSSLAAAPSAVMLFN